MQTQYSQSDKDGLKALVRQLNGFGFPGFWQLRWMCFRILLYFLHKQFVKQDRKKPELYQIAKKGSRFEVRRGTSDSFVIDEVWQNHEYGENHTGIVLDIGANIGAFSIYAAQTAEHVIAIEASTQNFQRLQKNIKLNALDNMSTIHACAASQDGKSTLNFHDVNNGMSSTLFKGPSKTSETVENITFKTLFEAHQIERLNFVKCDIEGGEFDVFSGANLPYLSRVSSISMEIHCNYATPDKVRKLLLDMADAGFDLRISNPSFLMWTGTGILHFTKNQA